MFVTCGLSPMRNQLIISKLGMISRLLHMKIETFIPKRPFLGRNDRAGWRAAAPLNPQLAEDALNSGPKALPQYYCVLPAGFWRKKRSVWHRCGDLSERQNSFTLDRTFYQKPYRKGSPPIVMCVLASYSKTMQTNDNESGK